MRTPLHMASQYGYFGIVQRLLKHPDIDVNVEDMEHNSPLHYAS